MNNAVRYSLIGGGLFTLFILAILAIIHTVYWEDYYRVRPTEICADATEKVYRNLEESKDSADHRQDTFIECLKQYK